MGMVKNKYGQYFTKDTIADFMVSLIQKPKTASVLEPSCGKGVFLSCLSKAGFSTLSAYEIDKTLQPPFGFVKYESFISSPVEDKYDVIIGNPPYIRWKNLEEELKAELQVNLLWNKYFNSLCDYSFIFILKSIEQLTEGGELIFICSEYWLNTTNSLSLRNYMCEHGYFTDIYHFKEAPLFEKVTASLIVFRYVKGKPTQDNINLYLYNRRGCPDITALNTLSCFNHTVIPQFKKNSRWALVGQNQQDRLKAFERACCVVGDLFSQRVNRIGDYCDIGNGMVSGLDRAFVINNTSGLTDFETECLVQVLKAKDIEQYKFKQPSHYIKVPMGMSEDKFNRECPNFVEHFAPFKENLDMRYNYGRKIPYWEFVFPRNERLFRRNVPKIFVPCKERISNKSYFRFCFAPIGYYPLQDVTGIVKKQSTKESVEYILAFLNTSYVFDWLSYNGIVKGAIVEFSEAPIANIPFRNIDWNNKADVAIHDIITKEVQQYLIDGDQKHLNTISNNFEALIYGNN